MAIELLEREQCFTELTAWLEAAVGRSGCLALVSGEAGIGKTALLQEFAKRQSCARRVLWGACDALFTPRPLGPLHDIARQTEGALAEALSAPASREAIFSAALDELEHQHTPTLVVLEDMQWADEATLDLLKFLGRRIHRTRAMLVVTYRDDEVGARHALRFVVADLPRASVHRMSLGPLSEGAVAKLASAAGRSSEGLHRATDGNPFFVTEVLAAVADSIPVTVRDAVLARAARLSPAGREIAEVVAIVPGKTEAWLLQQAAQVDDAGLEGCLSIGMVRDEDGSLAFRHELARRALEDALSPARQQALHVRVLSILAQRPEVSHARLAHHAAGAHSARDILRFAPIATAQAASVGAHREAAAQYEVALHYSDELSATERATLLEQVSYECYLTDQIERAIEARRTALEIWKTSGSGLREGDALRWLSRLSWILGREVEADRYAAEAVATLESLPAGPELAMAYSNRSQLAMLAHEVDPAISWAHRAIELAERFGNDEILSHALNNLGTARLLVCDAAGWSDLERSLQLARAAGFHEHVARAYVNLAANAVEQHLYANAARYLSDGLAYCEEHDVDYARPYMLALRARARFGQGDWQTACEDAEAVLAHPETMTISRITALTALGHVRVRRGDADASSPLEEARTLAVPTRGLQHLGPLAAARADAACLASDRERTIELQTTYELARESHDPWMSGALAIRLWRGGALSEPPQGIAEPYALEVAGDLRGAARAWETLGCPYEHATALALIGTEREQLQALAILERLGAAPAARALRRHMRARGIRCIPRGAITSTRSHPHGLTKREVEILAQLSEGLHNSAIAKRLFLSPKTIEHHVSAILAKLNVPSRAAAVAMAGKRPKARGD